jgi:hypothetical protein
MFTLEYKLDGSDIFYELSPYQKELIGKASKEQLTNDLIGIGLDKSIITEGEQNISYEVFVRVTVSPINS